MTDNYICLLLGSNIQPEDNISKAINLLEANFPIVSISQIWETPPYKTEGENFLNAAVLLRAQLNPISDITIKLRELEKIMGRKRTEDKYASRTIDLDVVVYNSSVIDNDLWELPHIAVPVSNILPCLTSPATGENLHVIADRLKIRHPLKPRSDFSFGQDQSRQDLVC